jgi:2-polyprenyl-3-methyl-5-hydroxy-6-metoxy-1,4-benzoquinol methylase
MSAQKWIAAYQTKPVEALGWYAASLETSHRLVSNHLSVELRDAAVIDVGAGASVFADHMIEDGCLDITLLDLSSEALAITLSRLNGDEAITSIVGNVLDCQSLRLSGYDVWHDRAVFHFLTRKADRQAYVKKARLSLATDGIIVLGTFAPDGPEMCNNLPVRRCGLSEIMEDFSPWFDLVHSVAEVHTTPTGGKQSYNYFVLKKGVH